jgi:hypothetical protein
MTPLDRVTDRALRNGDPEGRSTPQPLLTLEEFFEGNDETGSIGCNLMSEPEPAQFYELFRAIRERPEVSDVRVQITSVDEPGTSWPFSDKVLIMTDRPVDEVIAWFPEDLAPDEAWEGWDPGTKYEPCPVLAGHRPVTVWYD